MLKLTKLHYEISDDTQKRIADITEIYQEQVAAAQIVGKPIPEAPKVKLKTEDYKCTETTMYLEIESIESIEVSEEDDTQIVTKTGGLYIVKEKPEEILNSIRDAKQI
jgi:uncharacterized protein YlzI (FlbEa/FlbD family)